MITLNNKFPVSTLFLSFHFYLIFVVLRGLWYQLSLSYLLKLVIYIKMQNVFKFISAKCSFQIYEPNIVGLLYFIDFSITCLIHRHLYLYTKTCISTWKYVVKFAVLLVSLVTSLTLLLLTLKFCKVNCFIKHYILLVTLLTYFVYN